ncbi:MAG: hypothetical protein WAV82_07235 [Methylobacter sp.]
MQPDSVSLAGFVAVRASFLTSQVKLVSLILFKAAICDTSYALPYALIGSISVLQRLGC